jgi:hypothetical protein
LVGVSGVRPVDFGGMMVVLVAWLRDAGSVVEGEMWFGDADGVARWW